jgi:hypothetical protein
VRKYSGTLARLTSAMTTEASFDLVRGCVWTVGAVVALKVALLAGGWSRHASQEAAMRQEMSLAAGSCCTGDLAERSGSAPRRDVQPAVYAPEIGPRGASPDDLPCRGRRSRR